MSENWTNPKSYSLITIGKFVIDHNVDVLGQVAKSEAMSRSQHKLRCNQGAQTVSGPSFHLVYRKHWLVVGSLVKQHFAENVNVMTDYDANGSDPWIIVPGLTCLI